MTTNRPLAVLLVAAVLCACGKTREKEPNDDFSTATPVKAGSVEGTLSSAKDVDFYRLDVDQEPATLFAHLSGIRDADFGAETAEMSKNQILQQAGTAILAQAKGINQGALQLLQ